MHACTYTYASVSLPICAGKQSSLKVLMLSFESLLEVVPTLQCHMEWCTTDQTASRKERWSCMHLSEETWRTFTQRLQSVLKDLTVTSSKSKRCVYVCAYIRTCVMLQHCTISVELCHGSG